MTTADVVVIGGGCESHEKGSNGGVHRGPDLKPRLFVPSLLIKAFTDKGEIAPQPEPYKQRSGAQKRKRSRGRHAGTLNAVTMIQGIMLRGAEGDETACAQGTRVLRDMHETLQPTPHEAKKGGQGPIIPQFNRPSQTAAPAPPRSSAPAVEEPRASVIGPDGTEYVEPE
jgi:hypothetical protein